MNKAGPTPKRPSPPMRWLVSHQERIEDLKAYPNDPYERYTYHHANLIAAITYQEPFNPNTEWDRDPVYFVGGRKISEEEFHRGIIAPASMVRSKISSIRSTASTRSQRDASAASAASAASTRSTSSRTLAQRENPISISKPTVPEGLLT